MKSIFLFYCLVIYSMGCWAQYNFAKQWDYRYGGAKNDGFDDCIQTREGNFLLGGESYSRIGGDKTQDNWDTTASGYDYWVVMTNASGQKIWDKRFGGLGQDGLWKMLQTFDDNFIIAGYSSSQSGDVTEPARGDFDYWIVKVDNNGNKMWDKRFGAPGEDELTACVQTRDSGFLLAGFSYSDTGGDKQEQSRGGTDYWAVKIDEHGNLQWERRFGGNQYDFLYDAVETADGGYLLGGYSNSEQTGGDKTEPNFDNTYNFWIVKIDSSGSKVWDHVYGGTGGEYFRAMLALPDKGFLLGGSSYSDTSGNKTSPLKGISDYWLVKIDSAGNKLWDRDYGCIDCDNALWRLALAKDGGYLLSGQCSMFSGASGDKSENNPITGALPWIIKTDSAGNKQWDKSIFLSRQSGMYARAIETLDGCYAFGVYTAAEIGYYKTQATWDSSSDYWLVKFCLDTANGIEETKIGDAKISVYPNPFTSDVSINLQTENLHEATFVITNSLGQIIYRREEDNLANSYTKMLDLSYLPDGIYNNRSLVTLCNHNAVKCFRITWVARATTKGSRIQIDSIITERYAIKSNTFSYGYYRLLSLK